MRESLSPIFACPECNEPIDVQNRASVFQLTGEQHLVEGTVACRSGHRFPVLDEVPRLVPRSMLNEEELGVFSRCSEGPAPKQVEPRIVEGREFEDLLRSEVEAEYGLSDRSDSAHKARAASALSYKIDEFRGLNKAKYLAPVRRLVESADSILEVGSGLPGLIRCFSGAYTPETSVVADLAIQYADAFKTPNRSALLVRADVQRLPFSDARFDLILSAFMLEHVPDWRTAVLEMKRVGTTTFVAFGPNRWFPFEIGHLNAPLAGSLPKNLAAYVTFLWLRATRNPRTLTSIRKSLGNVNHVSSSAFQSFCRVHFDRVTNLFPQIVASIASDRTSSVSLSRRLIRSFPGSAQRLAEFLTLLRMEPQMYFLLGRRNSVVL